MVTKRVTKKDQEILITVAVVCYSHGPRFHSCMDSILQQTYDKIDLVVVDDFSCDFDVSEVNSYIRGRNAGNLSSVSVEKFPEHRGPGSAYKRALELARGEYILFIGGDDRLASRTVLKEVAEKLSAESTDVLQGRGVFQLGKEILSLPGEDSLQNAKKETLVDFIHSVMREPSAQILCIQSAIFRVSTLCEMNAFPDRYSFSVDWPLYMQLLLNGANLSVTSTVVTQMHSGGPYRKDSIGTIYIKKGYLSEAAQAVREYAVEKRKASLSAEEVLLLESAANSLEAFCVINYDWYYYSFRNKARWIRCHRDYFRVHRMVLPDSHRQPYSIKHLFFLLLSVFLLGMSYVSLSGGLSVSTENPPVNFPMFFIATMGIPLLISFLQNKVPKGKVKCSLISITCFLIPVVFCTVLFRELQVSTGALDAGNLFFYMVVAWFSFYITFFQDKTPEGTVELNYFKLARFLALILLCRIAAKTTVYLQPYTVVGVVFILCAFIGMLALAERVIRKLQFHSLVKRIAGRGDTDGK